MSAGSMEGVRQILRNVAQKGFFHLLSANILIGFLAFGSQLLVVKFLKPEQMGQIKAMQAFVSIAVVFAGFGLNTAVLKLCSEKRPDGEKAFILKKNLAYSVGPVFISLVVLTILSQLHLLSPDEAVNRWMPLYMFVIPASVVTALLMVYLQALKKIQLMAKAQIFIRTSGFAALVCLTYFAGMRGYVWVTVTVGYLAMAALFATVRGHMSGGSSVHDVQKQSLYYGRWSLAANATAMTGKFLDILLLNYLIGDRVSFGYYGIATIFIAAMEEVTHTVQAISTPYFSEKSHDRPEFMRVFKKYQKLMVTLALAVSAAAIIVVPPFIHLIYGADYALAGQIFRILVLKYLFWSCFALSGVAILGLGKMKYNFLSSFVVLPASFLLSIVCIRAWGFMGAAFAQVGAYFISMLVVGWMFNRVTKAHFA